MNKPHIHATILEALKDSPGDLALYKFGMYIGVEFNSEYKYLSAEIAALAKRKPKAAKAIKDALGIKD